LTEDKLFHMRQSYRLERRLNLNKLLLQIHFCLLHQQLTLKNPL